MTDKNVNKPPFRERTEGNLPQSTAKELLGTFGSLVDEKARTFLARGEQETYGEMYGAMRYFMGYADERLAPMSEASVGKRFRSGLCLLLANEYTKKEVAIPAALSVELFHNCTLIHDDIVDGDKDRRGRETVWAKFGMGKAVHIGDGQLLLALSALETEGSHTSPRVRAFLLEKYLEVFEGQYLDAMLTEYAVDDPRATEELYLEMLTKKTSVLVGASARVAGMAAEVTAEEEEKLWQYGLSLGIAYQMYDDLASIWGSTDATGKEAHGDIREKKKTLPILYAVKKLPEAEKNELVSLYNTSGSLDDTAVARVIELLNSVDAYTHVRALVDHHKDAALAIVSTLSVSENGARTLSDLVKALLPEARST